MSGKSGAGKERMVSMTSTVSQMLLPVFANPVSIYFAWLEC